MEHWQQPFITLGYSTQLPFKCQPATNYIIEASWLLKGSSFLPFLPPSDKISAISTSFREKLGKGKALARESSEAHGWGAWTAVEEDPSSHGGVEKVFIFKNVIRAGCAAMTTKWLLETACWRRHRCTTVTCLTAHHQWYHTQCPHHGLVLLPASMLLPVLNQVKGSLTSLLIM